MKNKLKILAVLIVAYWSSWAQFNPSHLEYNIDDIFEKEFVFHVHGVLNSNYIYHKTKDMPNLDSIIINSNTYGNYKYYFDYNANNQIIATKRQAYGSTFDYSFEYENNMLAKIICNDDLSSKNFFEYRYNSEELLEQIYIYSISQLYEIDTITRHTINYHYNLNNQLIKIESLGEYVNNLYILYDSNNRIAQMKRVNYPSSSEFILDDSISVIENSSSIISPLNCSGNCTHLFIQDNGQRISGIWNTNNYCDIEVLNYNYVDSGYSIIKEQFEMKLIEFEDSIVYLKTNRSPVILFYNNDDELIKVEKQYQSIIFNNTGIIENTISCCDSNIYQSEFNNTFIYDNQDSSIVLYDSVWVLNKSLTKIARIRTFNENGDILTYKMDDYEISYYYQTDPLAKKISLDGNKLIVEFNYNLDIEADMMDYIQFNTELTKSDVELLRILSVSVSESNNKLLIIEFNRNIEVGEVFALESATGLPLRDGRMAPLSIKTADLTEIAENNNASELQVSINCNSVIATNTVGIEKVEVYTNTGIQLMSYPAKGNNKVEVKLPRAVSDMLIISVTESGGNVQSFKSVCE